MSPLAQRPPNLIGGPLRPADHDSLLRRWITREYSDTACLTYVPSIEGARVVGREGKPADYSGILIPYMWAGENSVRDYRLRRDHPDMEQTADGIKQRRKYMSPPRGGNMLYIPPLVEAPLLQNTEMPLVVVEGEFKVIALWRLAWHGLGDAAEAPAFIPVGLPGVNSWRGKLGRVEAEGPGQWSEVKGPIADLGRIAWGGRKVIILFDSNVETNLGVGCARRDLTHELESRGADVAHFRWPSNVGEAINGIDDFLAERGPEETIRQIGKARQVTRKRGAPPSVAEAIAGVDGWRKGLITTGNGGIKPNLANAITILRNHPELRNMLSYDQFSLRIMALRGSPWDPKSREWGEVDSIRLAEFLQRLGCGVGKTTAAEVAEAVAREQSFHPVREYLGRLQWDGQPRIDTWLCVYVGVEDSEYSRAVGSRWLISAVARVKQPGCKADHCLILQGAQGIMKSTALRVLGGEWFADQVGDLSQKDSAQQIHGVWVVEFAELEQLLGLRAEIAQVKAFITRQIDRFRPPYERKPADFPRQCVFAGTVNLDTFFRDETGARRFWVVSCGAIDIPALERDRDQLWAEARARYEAGEPWYLDTAELVDLAAGEQDRRYEGDPWDTPCMEYVEGARAAFVQGGSPPEEFCVTNEEILGKALKKPESAWQDNDKRRIGRIMRRHGLVYKQESVYDADDVVVREPNGRTKRRRVYRWSVGQEGAAS